MSVSDRCTSVNVGQLAVVRVLAGFGRISHLTHVYMQFVMGTSSHSGARNKQSLALLG
jgi:hypothetical protein